MQSYQNKIAFSPEVRPGLDGEAGEQREQRDDGRDTRGCKY